MSKPLRIVMFPGRGNRDENRYIDLLADGLRQLGVVVVDWDKELGWQAGDIFHVHWPEVIVHIRRRRFQLLRGWWIERQFWWTLGRIKRRGGRLFWTLHDLKPHDQRLHRDRVLDRLFDRFYTAVDGVFCLTRSAFEPVKAEIPALAGATLYLGRHPHYRPVLAPPIPSAERRAALGAHPEDYVLGFLGTMRPNKGPVALGRAFAALEPDYFLVMAGSAAAEIEAGVRQAVAGSDRAFLQFARIAEPRMIELYAALDALVFPGTDYFNSGTIYTALSLNVPVIAAWSPVNAEIQQLVGPEWLYLFHNELQPDDLRAARASLVDRSQNPVCDLGAFDPRLCAVQHRDAYLDALARPARH